MNQKTLISVLVVLVAILGGTTIYFLTAQKSVAPVVSTPVPVSKTVPVTEKTSPIVQSTPVAPVVQDETAGWKTYTDTKLGFEFKHPNGWIVDKERTSAITTVFIKSNALSGSDREAISVEDNTSNLTIDQILDKTCKDGWGGCERKDIIIAGEKGKTFSMGGFGVSVIVVLHDGHKYTIETQGNLFNDSVLKTFQFTK